MPLFRGLDRSHPARVLSVCRKRAGRIGLAAGSHPVHYETGAYGDSAMRGGSPTELRAGRNRVGIGAQLAQFPDTLILAAMYSFLHNII